MKSLAEAHWIVWPLIFACIATFGGLVAHCITYARAKEANNVSPPDFTLLALLVVLLLWVLTP
jgi:hypothetical protein